MTEAGRGMLAGRRAAPDQRRVVRLPARSSLRVFYVVSLAIAAGASLVCIWGLAFGPTIYPSDELLRTFVPNDAATLFVGVPILLGSMWLARRGWLLGLLSWPGALLFVLYDYLAYVLAMPLGVTFLVYLTLVAASLYVTVGLLGSIDADAVQQRLTGAVSERIAAGVLSGLGFLFVASVIGAIAAALASQSQIPETELAVHMADFLIAPAWIITGVLLWRRQRFGYVAGLGLLIQGSMLFVALIVFILLKPVLANVPLAVADIAVVLAMGLVCFVPTALFARGVMRSAG